MHTIVSTKALLRRTVTIVYYTALLPLCCTDYRISIDAVPAGGNNSTIKLLEQKLVVGQNESPIGVQPLQLDHITIRLRNMKIAVAANEQLLAGVLHFLFFLLVLFLSVGIATNTSGSGTISTSFQLTTSSKKVQQKSISY